MCEKGSKITDSKDHLTELDCNNSQGSLFLGSQLLILHYLRLVLI